MGFLARLHLCLFYSSQCALFILFCGEDAQLAFRSFSERTVLYVAVDLVCPWQEVGSGPSYASILRNVLIFNGQKWRKNTQTRQGPKETGSFFNWLEEKEHFWTRYFLCLLGYFISSRCSLGSQKEPLPIAPYSLCILIFDGCC